MKSSPVVAGKSMKAYLDSKKRETRLVGPLERHLLAKPFDDRRMDIIHPSDVIKPEWCALAQYHALSGNYKETRDKVGLRLQSIFDEGHAIHHKWQSWLGEMGVLYGYWKCSACGKSKTMTLAGHMVHNAPCTDVGGVVEYAEVPLISEKYMIAGHSDGWVKNLGDDYLIEIKSLGPGTFRMEAPGLIAGTDGDVEAAFRAVRQPFNSHFLQGQVYLHLAHLMVEEGLLESAPEEIVFIYELKSNQDYKEFVVGYDAEYTADIFEACADVAWAVNNKRPPACSVNPVKGCKRCAPYRGEEDAK